MGVLHNNSPRSKGQRRRRGTKQARHLPSTPADGVENRHHVGNTNRPSLPRNERTANKCGSQHTPREVNPVTSERGNPGTQLYFALHFERNGRFVFACFVFLPSSTGRDYFFISILQTVNTQCQGALPFFALCLC